MTTPNDTPMPQPDQPDAETVPAPEAAPAPEGDQPETRHLFHVTHIQDHGEGTGQSQRNIVAATAEEALEFIEHALHLG